MRLGVAEVEVLRQATGLKMGSSPGWIPLSVVGTGDGRSYMFLGTTLGT